MTSQKERPAISIVLPALNAGKTLEHSVASMIHQSFEDWELLLVDDGSTDGTVEIARQFKDPRIVVVADGTHRGLPGRLNQAVDLARGKYLARMDADDIAYPERLRKQIDYLATHSEVDLLGCSLAIFRSGGSLTGVRRLPATHAEICARPWAGFPMSHPSWMGRTEWFRRHPYLVDAVRMEDQELLLRTHSSSRFANLPELLLGYREDSFSISKQLIARKNCGKYTWRWAGERKAYGIACRAIIGVIARATLDVVAISTGLERVLLGYRARPARAAEAEGWARVWESISSEHANTRPAEVQSQ